MLQKIFSMLFKTTPTVGVHVVYNSDLNSTIITVDEQSTVSEYWVYSITNNDTTTITEDIYKVIVPVSQPLYYDFIEGVIYKLRAPITVTKVPKSHVERLLEINE